MPHPAHLTLPERVAALEVHHAHGLERIADVIEQIKTIKTRLRAAERLGRLALGMGMLAMSVAANLRPHELVALIKSLSSLMGMML